MQSLAHRAKWTKTTENVKENDVVMILEDNDLNLLKWKMDVVIKTYPGKDGKVRVVNVRTANGVLKRGIQKLSKLPVDINNV